MEGIVSIPTSVGDCLREKNSIRETMHAMGRDEAITQRQGVTNNRAPIKRDVNNELDIELEERIPQTLPRQTFWNQALIRLAMEGQPADLANMAIKNAMENKEAFDIKPNKPVASIQKPIENRNILRPPK